jgi:uncharacterized paraquat-inducible protein A
MSISEAIKHYMIWFSLLLGLAVLVKQVFPPLAALLFFAAVFVPVDRVRVTMLKNQYAIPF